MNDGGEEKEREKERERDSGKPRVDRIQCESVASSGMGKLVERARE